MASKVEPVLFAGIDDGRAFTKVYVGGGKQLKIRTSVMTGLHAGKSGLTAQGTEENGSYETEGIKYTVGNRIDGEDTRFEHFDGSGINRVAIHHSLMLSGFSGKRVKIATGLPVSSYYLGNAINKARIDKKRSLLSQPVFSLNSKPAAEIVSNIVCAEALSAWLDDVLDEDGQVKAGADMKNAVGVVDFGGRTLDTIWINPPDMISHNKSGSAPIGVLDLFDVINEGLRAKFGIDEFSRTQLEGALATKSIRLYSENHDVADIVDRAVEEIVTKVDREIQRRFGQAAELDRILFVGGGVAALPQIAKRYKNAILVKDPEFANARGMYKFLKHTHKGD